MIYQNPSTKHEDYLFQIIDQGSLKDSKNNIEYVFSSVWITEVEYLSLLLKTP